MLHIKNITKHRRIISERGLQCGANLAEECKGVVIDYTPTASERKEMKQTKQRESLITLDSFIMIFKKLGHIIFLKKYFKSSEVHMSKRPCLQDAVEAVKT